MAELKYYIIRRILTFLPTLIGLTLITFVVSMLVPGNPARLWAGGIKASPEVIEAVKKRYHLDEPLYMQYYYYLRNLLRGDLGVSPLTHRPVITDIISYFPATVELAIFAELLVILMGIPLGIISALKRDSVIDHAVRVFSLIGVSVPVFWLGLMLQWLFYYYLGWLPAGGRGPAPPRIYTKLYVLDSLLCGRWDLFWSNVAHIILPAFTLAYIGVGMVARVTRSSVLDVLSSDFVMFLNVKGLSRLSVLRHVIKNALVPIVTILGLEFGGLLGGAVITETIFFWPGIGRYAVQGINSLDFPAIMGVTVLIGLIYIIVNLAVDLLYAVIDPRVRL